MSEQVADKQVCFRCLVAGRVQGVFFRAATREQAQRLGLTGHARNLPDGRVEVLACGEPDAVAQLREWLRGGPPAAQVTGIACEPETFQQLHGFDTR
ncbi:MAG: acylphosphatase [Candidatus Thiosymbion ectosymbiont of Robbea hypermnestra]|nr:acylphosphatase [Candidatus Thiosymbion ectosymbiont of Robbea hypermnestra]